MIELYVYSTMNLSKNFVILQLMVLNVILAAHCTVHDY